MIIDNNKWLIYSKNFATFRRLMRYSSILKLSHMDIHSQRTAATDRRYRIIATILTLESRLEQYSHTPESFEATMDTLDRVDTDVLEAMAQAYELRCGDQFEGADAPVVEHVPINYDELANILAINKIVSI